MSFTIFNLIFTDNTRVILNLSIDNLLITSITEERSKLTYRYKYVPVTLKVN